MRRSAGIWRARRSRPSAPNSSRQGSPTSFGRWNTGSPHRLLEAMIYGGTRETQGNLIKPPAGVGPTDHKPLGPPSAQSGRRLGGQQAADRVDGVGLGGA